MSTILNEKPSRSSQRKFSASSNKGKEAVVMPLPISMDTGQIIMLTKMMTTSDLRFYDFEADVPIETWHT
ncbi:MAG TPA: hypothetical protein VJ875_03530 [Pyrinomonadaceae bacterium]|nr:hypothetical protein [Pyrinomonadaceae bacterium]